MVVKEGNTAVEETVEEENPDVLENENDQEGAEDVVESEGESNSNEEAVDGENGEGDQEVDGEAEQAEEIDPVKEITYLKETIKQLQDRLEKGEKKAPETETIREPSEEEKIKFEENTGVSWKAHTHMAKMASHVFNQVVSMIEERLSGPAQNETMKELAKDKQFADIEQHKDGINEFLKKFKPESRKDKQLVMDAYYWAKGRGADKSIKKVITSKERNKKIVSSVQVAKPNSGLKPGSTGKGSVKLTPIEESARKAAGMTVEEYVKYRKKR